MRLLCCTRVRARKDPLHEQTEQFFSACRSTARSRSRTPTVRFTFSAGIEPRVRLVALRNAYTAAAAQRRFAVETKIGRRVARGADVIPRVHGIFADRSGTIDYTVNVPETARLKLATGERRTRARSARRPSASIELTNGRITSLNCFARVEAPARVNGVMDVFLRVVGKCSRDLRLRSCKHGRIGALLPAVAQFRIDAAKRRRDGSGTALLRVPGYRPANRWQVGTRATRPSVPPPHRRRQYQHRPLR